MGQNIKIRVNSKPGELPYTMTVEQFLAHENVPSGGTAVAINGKIVRRHEWATRMIAEGDDIIIIKAAYGG